MRDPVRLVGTRCTWSASGAPGRHPSTREMRSGAPGPRSAAHDPSAIGPTLEPDPMRPILAAPIGRMTATGQRPTATGPRPTMRAT